MLMGRNATSCIFSSPNASRDGSCVSFDRTNVTRGADGGERAAPLYAACTVRYKGLLFTARFIFHRNIMENGPSVMRNV